MSKELKTYALLIDFQGELKNLRELKTNALLLDVFWELKELRESKELKTLPLLIAFR